MPCSAEKQAVTRLPASYRFSSLLWSELLGHLGIGNEEAVRIGRRSRNLPQEGAQDDLTAITLIARCPHDVAFERDHHLERGRPYDHDLGLPSKLRLIYDPPGGTAFDQELALGKTQSRL